MVQALIHRIAVFDGSVAHLTVKDCTYRFYRDTRFSEDKSPYKRHFGAYINACGKKSWHSGYYFHLQPGECLLAGGSWCLPSPILKAVRQSIVDFPYPDYLRPKDYSVCHTVPDDFFRDENWLDRTAEIFELMKPFNDFVNYTIDECE